MPLSGTLIAILGPAIAKTILGSWLSDTSLAKAVGDEMVDKLKDSIMNSSERQNTQRGIEQIGKQIAAQMRPIFDREASHLDSGSRTAIQLAIVDTLRQTDVTNELLMSYGLDAGRLREHLSNAFPEATRHFGRDETALYELLLTEVSHSIISVAPQLEDFSRSFAVETLHRLDEIAEDVRARREQLRQAMDEFERKYRATVIRELDHMEMFGLPRMDRLTSQQNLSMAYVTLSVTQQGSDQLDRDTEIIGRTLVQEITAYPQQQDTLSSSRSRPVDQTLTDCRRLIIRGDAGAGKSTLLQWLAVRAAKQDFPPRLAYWNWKIPFFIRLRTLVDKGFPTPEDFPRLIAPNHTDIMPKGWVHQSLTRGQALVLIDGVDELPRQQRQDFLKNLKDLVADFPEACYVVTSRPSGLKNEQGEAWDEWEAWTQEEKFANLMLEPMNTANVEQFITLWHGALATAYRPQNSRSDIERERVDAHFNHRLKSMALPEEVTGVQIRALFVERAGLLREPVVGRIDFAHRTFQEFLAAQAALNEDSIGVLLQHAHDDQWREAIIVAAGLARPRERAELLKGLLQMGHEMPERRHYLHLLAVACLKTTIEVSPDVRTEVIEQARTLLPPKDKDEVGMVAKAGDAIVPLLAANPSYSEEEATFCIAGSA